MLPPKPRFKSQNTYPRMEKLAGQSRSKYIEYFPLSFKSESPPPYISRMLATMKLAYDSSRDSNFSFLW